MTEHLDKFPEYMIEHLRDCSICGEKMAKILTEIHNHIPKELRP